jgi:cytochrome c oxidase subunit 4
MKTSEKPHFIRPCTRVWLILVIFTLMTWAIGESGLGGTHIMLIVLGAAFIKVELVASYFMGLRRTRWLWRGIMLGWLILVTALITVAYLSST